MFEVKDVGIEMDNLVITEKSVTGICVVVCEDLETGEETFDSCRFEIFSKPCTYMLSYLKNLPIVFDNEVDEILEMITRNLQDNRIIPEII